jgi:hypothetical protein
MWRSRFNAAPLIKNDTIALIGGFGEYNEAKNIVYYDDVLREWYEYKIKLKQFEDLILFAQYDSVSDQLIGISADQANFKYFEYEFKEDIFFDLITEELLGNFYGVFPIHQFPQPLFLSNSDEILKWNLEEKTYSLYRFDKELINARYFVNYNPASKVFLVFDDNRNELLTVNENLLFSQPIKTVSFQLAQKANNKNYLIISLIIILFGLLFLIFIRRRSVAKVVLSKKEEILSELSEAEAIIFTKIVESHPKPIELTELQQDFEPQLTYESRLKKLRKCLTSIENLAREKASVSKSKEVFIHSQSREDKRIKLIRLNQH